MTPFSEFYPPIRALLDDSDPDIQLYESSQIDAAMKTVLGLGKVVGIDGTVYRNSGSNVTPDLASTPTNDSDYRAWALLVYHAARVFAVGKRTLSWRTRAFAETTGSAREMVDSILNEIYRIESGASMGSSEI